MKNRISTEVFLRDTELPEATKTYTVIPHGYIIDTIREKIAENNFVIESEVYAADNNGRVAFGSFIIQTEGDKEMAMSFNFANSYDKSLRFNCSIGGYVYDIASQFVSHELESDWKRKHTGTAYDEVHEIIDNMIAYANDHFEEMLGIKETFKRTPISHKQIAQVAGILYFDKQAILGEQAAIFKKEFTIPSYDYKETNNLWYFYKLMMVAIRGTTITQWVKQQMKISMYMRISKEWLLTDASPISDAFPAPVNVEKLVHSLVETDDVIDEELHEEKTPDVIDVEDNAPNAQYTESEDKTAEDEISHSLYGVDNDNIEVSLTQEEEYVETEEVIEEFEETTEEEEVVETVQEKATVFKIDLAPKKAVKEKKTPSKESFTEERIEAIKEEMGMADVKNQAEEVAEVEENLFDEEVLIEDLEVMEEDLEVMEEDDFETVSEEVEELLETSDDVEEVAEVVEEPAEKPLYPVEMEEQVKMISETNYPNGVSFKASTDNKKYIELITTADEVLVIEK